MILSAMVWEWARWCVDGSGFAGTRSESVVLPPGYLFPGSIQRDDREVGGAVPCRAHGCNGDDGVLTFFASS